MNSLAGNGLWDEDDGFYYDQLKTPGGRQIPLKTRSLVGLLPLIAVEVIETAQIERLPGFKKRMEWFVENRLTVADLKCFLWVRWLKSGALDHIPADIVDRHAPLLAKHLERVRSEPMISAYYAARGK